MSEKLNPRNGSLMDRRRRTLGPHSPTFYDNPLELVSGRGVWVKDADGRAYLDAYNNVPLEPATESALLDKGLADVDVSIDSLQTAGLGVAALFLDPLFPTEGLVRAPEGYVEGLVERVHRAGASMSATRSNRQASHLRQ